MNVKKLISYNNIFNIIYDLYFNMNDIKIMIYNYPLIINDKTYIFLFLI